MSDRPAPERVRLDKWLWAARFFRTRAQAKQAIDGGKVHCDGARGKPAREIAVGSVLRVRRGPDERTVVVRALSERRGGAPEAHALYEETEESLARREAERQRRRRQREAMTPPDHRPSRRDRRTLAELKKKGELP